VSFPTVYDKSTWTDLSDFTIVGQMPSISSGAIVLNPNPGSSWDSQALTINGTTTLSERIDIVLTASVVDPTLQNGSGIAIGKNALTGILTALSIQWQFSGVTGGSVLQFWNQASGVPDGSRIISSKTIAVAVRAGDTISLTYSQRGATFTATAVNTTQGTTGSLTIVSNLDSVTRCNFFTPASSPITVYGLGGSCKVQRIQVTDAQTQSAYLTCLGDSKTAGYAALTDAQRFSQLLNLSSVNTCGGFADGCVPVLASVPYLLKQKPLHVLLALGSNDIRNGVAASTWQTAYASIVSAIKAASIPLVHLLPIPETAIDQSGLKSYIQSTFANDAMIDPSVGWMASYISDDGVHPNVAGHAAIAAKITAAGIYSK
jgi:lysophospholipase L1-like esterase